MTYADRWLLPDGVEDILPDRADRIEWLRRALVDLYRVWGYELVIPPLLEYTDSLLIGLGRDVDLMTFKVTDQLSGRMMGIRADITPQIARMDAHSFSRSGPSRLCYAGPVLHTKPKSPLATRSPIQAGVELFGEAGLDGDVEVISLMVASLQAAGLSSIHVDLGHVGIYRALAAEAGFSAVQEEDFFDLLQAKAMTDITVWLQDNVDSAELAARLKALPLLAGGREALAQARTVLAGAAEEVLAALDELEAVADAISQRCPQTELYFDLGELRGYHYHTGIVFAAFAPGLGEAVANGGRYDHVGEVFGRPRPATGFAVDITALHQLSQITETEPKAVFVAAEYVGSAWQTVCDLRASGRTVLCGFAGQVIADAKQRCDAELVPDGDSFVLKSL